jgi:hypothetical protein
MDQLDVYYRALLDYKNAIKANKDCLKLNNAFLSADADSDKLVITRAFCTIDEEWVTEIEKGLVFIEKAIKEDRQFILSQGEVIPIEKVKSVSKESVQHLAKHSDLISEYEEGEDIIPDKLYTVERLNDYTVYENRFLYMLLCYLRDFVSLRYTKIVEATNKYDAELTLDKHFLIGKQTINYSVKLRDIRQDDEYLKAHNEAKEVIDRIMLILKAVLSFLSTPLMEYQAKVPMIKPPITKTNVLKMNNNFKGAVALYDYIISYDKQGYTIENQVTTVAPFSSEMAEEFAQAGGMLTFLSYEYGLGLKQDLKFSYEREEERRKDALVQKVKDQVASLNKRLQKAEISPEEYILKLEEQIKVLEKQCERMEMLRKEVDRLKVNENKLLADIKIAYLDISKLKSEILAKEYEKIQALDEAQRECSQKMAALTDALNAEKLEATAKLIEEINQLQGKIGDLIEINRSESDEMQKTLNMKTEEYNTLMFEFEKTREEKRFAEARLKSYRFKNHDMTDTDDYTDKDSFDELENELEVFIKFYKKEWTRTKRRIRKDLLNIKNIRKQNEHE